jgi:hypothetical protein
MGHTNKEAGRRPAANHGHTAIGQPWSRRGRAVAVRRRSRVDTPSDAARCSRLSADFGTPRRPAAHSHHHPGANGCTGSAPRPVRPREGSPRTGRTHLPGQFVSSAPLAIRLVRSQPIDRSRQLAEPPEDAPPGRHLPARAYMCSRAAFNSGPSSSARLARFPFRPPPPSRRTNGAIVCQGARCTPGGFPVSSGRHRRRCRARRRSHGRGWLRAYGTSERLELAARW